MLNINMNNQCGRYTKSNLGSTFVLLLFTIILLLLLLLFKLLGLFTACEDFLCSIFS